MKKILITGAFGFIGSHLLTEFKNSKIDFYTFSRSYKNSKTHFSGDFLATKVFDNILNEVKPEIIIHLAWETNPGKFYEDKTNLKWSDATIDLINKFYHRGGKKFIFSSTCDEYGLERIEENIDELKQCIPKTLYGKSKNLVTNYLEKNFKEKSVILRNFFVCGPGENKVKLLSSIISDANSNKLIKLKRPFDLIDFIDVRDVAKIILKFVEDDSYGIYNLGSSMINSPLSLAKKIIKIKGMSDKNLLTASFKKEDRRRIISDNSKLKKVLKYKIKFNIDKTISDLIKIYDV